MSLLIFLLLFFVALLAGNRLLRLFHCEFIELEEELIFSSALGLAILSYFVLGLGIFGFLERKFLWSGLGVLLVLGIPQIRSILPLLRKRKKERRGDSIPFWLELTFWLLVTFIGVGAVFPLFGTDALAYHLTCPKLFLRMGRIDWIPDEVNSLFPFFTEMLYTLGLALQGESVAQLFSWSVGVLLALSIATFFFRFFDSRKWGRIAAIFFLLTPGVFNEMRVPLVDVSWAAYGFLSFYALMVGLREEHRGWMGLSFLFLGVSLGVKYLAALSLLATLAVMAGFAFQSGWRPTLLLRWGLGLGIVLIAVSGYWYFKSYWKYGNPVYPYFNPLFGLEPLVLGAHAPGEYAHKVGLGRSIGSLLLLPFNLTFFPTRFDGWAEQLGPGYLVFLPFAFWGNRSLLRLALGVYAAVFTLGWFWLAQVTRFLYPALPFLTLLVVGGIYLFQEDQRRKLRLSPVFVIIVFLLQGSLLAYHSRQGWAYLAGFETKDAFLTERERSYVIAKFVNDNLPADAKILNAEEVRTFYFDRTIVRESLYRFRTKYDEKNDLEEALKRLKEDGFTHLLIADRDPHQGKKEGIRRWVSPDSKVKRMEQIHRSSFQEREGRTIEYALYQLK